MAAVALTSKQAVNQQIKSLTKQVKKDLWEAGISQEAVADAAGVTQGAVANQFRRGQLTLTVYLAAQLLLENK